MKNTLKLTLAVVLGVASVASVFAAGEPEVTNKALKIALAQAVVDLRVQEARDVVKARTDKYAADTKDKKEDEVKALKEAFDKEMKDLEVNAAMIKGIKEEVLRNKDFAGVKIEEIQDPSAACGYCAAAKQFCFGSKTKTAITLAATAVVGYGAYSLYAANQAEDAENN